MGALVTRGNRGSSNEECDPSVRRPAYRAPSVSLVIGKEALALNRLHRKLNVRKRRAPSNAAIGRERRIALLGLLEPGRSKCVSLVRYVYV